MPYTMTEVWPCRVRGCTSFGAVIDAQGMVTCDRCADELEALLASRAMRADMVKAFVIVALTFAGIWLVWALGVVTGVIKP